MPGDNRAREYREKAKKVRQLAGQMQHQDSRDQLKNVAEAFDRLAARSEAGEGNRANAGRSFGQSVRANALGDKRHTRPQ